jgi:hypothetical protein
MHESDEPSELAGFEPSSQIGWEPSSQAEPPPLTGIGVLASSQLASLHSIVAPAVAGQAGAEAPLNGVGSPPLAHTGSEPSAQEKPSLPSVGALPSSQNAEGCAGAAGACAPVLRLDPFFPTVCLARRRLALPCACAPRRRWVHARGWAPE